MSKEIAAVERVPQSIRELFLLRIRLLQTVRRSRSFARQKKERAWRVASKV
jgi:hypothetical protein